MKKLIIFLCLCQVLAGCSGKRLTERLTEKGRYNVAGYGQQYEVYEFDDLPGVEVHSFTSSDKSCTTYLLVEADDGDGQGVSYGSFSLYDSEAAYRFKAVSDEGFLITNGEQDFFVATEEMLQHERVDVLNDIPDDVEWVYPISCTIHNR